MRRTAEICICLFFLLLTMQNCLYCTTQADDIERYIKKLDDIECRRLDAMAAFQEQNQAQLFSNQQESAALTNQFMNTYNQLCLDLGRITPPTSLEKVHQNFLQFMRNDMEGIERDKPHYNQGTPSAEISRLESDISNCKKDYLAEKAAWAELAAISPVRMRVPDFRVRDYANEFYWASVQANINNMRRYSSSSGWLKEMSARESRRMFIEFFQDWGSQVESIRPQELPYLVEIHRNIVAGLRMLERSWEATTAEGEATQASQALMEDGYRIFFAAQAELYRLDRSSYLNNWVGPKKAPPIQKMPSATRPLESEAPKVATESEVMKTGKLVLPWQQPTKAQEVTKMISGKTISKPEIVGTTTFKGKQYFVTVDVKGNKATVWLCRSNTMSTKDDIKLMELTSRVTQSEEEAKRDICRKKHTLNDIRFYGGCAAAVGSAVVCTAGASTTGPAAPVTYFVCTVAITPYAQTIGAKDCIMGITGKVADALGKNKEWASVKTGVNIATGDMIGAVSSSLDLSCSDLKN